MFVSVGRKNKFLSAPIHSLYISDDSGSLTSYLLVSTLFHFTVDGIHVAPLDRERKAMLATVKCWFLIWFVSESSRAKFIFLRFRLVVGLKCVYTKFVCKSPLYAAPARKRACAAVYRSKWTIHRPTASSMQIQIFLSPVVICFCIVHTTQVRDAFAHLVYGFDWSVATGREWQIWL